MKSNKIFMAGALAFSMVLSGGMLTGCSNSSTKDTKTSEVTKKKEVKTIGKKTRDSKSLKFTNNTGKKITVFETKSSSNKNNSSSSSSKPSSKPSNSSNSSSSNSSKPAEHTHDWVAVTETRTVVDQPAYDEQVPITEMKAFDICNDCGAELNSSNIDSHVKDHMINDTGNGGWHTEWREVVTGYQTVHHDAVTHTETVTTGYRCSTCGATK